MMKVCSNMFVQCALKQAKPLLMGKVAVFILLLCSWHYLFCVSLDYYKIGELCVIIWEPSLPVAGVGAYRHSPLRSRRRTSSASIFLWAGTSCHISCEQVEEKLTFFSYSCSPTLLQNICVPCVLQIYLFSSITDESRSFCWCLGRKETGSSHRDSVALTCLS